MEHRKGCIDSALTDETPFIVTSGTIFNDHVPDIATVSTAYSTIKLNNHKISRLDKIEVKAE